MHSQCPTKLFRGGRVAPTQCTMAIEIDAEYLISLVKARPAIWNTSFVSYKDKAVTKESWRQIFKQLDSEYDTRSEEEQTYFGREVVKKWWNLRDTYVRSCKRIRTCKVTGYGHKIKKYVFADQLQFLSINKQETKEQDEPGADYRTVYLQDNSDNEEALEMVTDNDDESQLTSTSSVQKRKSEHEHDHRRVMSVSSEQKRHLCFFKGIVPSLQDFDEDETLEFQMGVLKIISAIKKRRHGHHNGNPVDINGLTTEGTISKKTKREPYFTSDTEVDPL